jgi:hypothetical protein
MLTKRLHDAGLRDWHMQSLSLGSIGLCIALWIRAKTVDQDERGNAERRALFVGLWPAIIWLIGDSLERRDHVPGRRHPESSLHRIASPRFEPARARIRAGKTRVTRPF